MLTIEHRVREAPGGDAGFLPDSILQSSEPVILRGLAAHWPLVQAAKRSGAEAIDYLSRHCNDASVTVSVGPPDIDGRIFYNEDLTGFNFKMERRRLDEVLGVLREQSAAERAPVYYVGSTTIDACLPRLREDNDIPIEGALASIWIGNRARIAAHFDVPDNLACVAAGRRRFILFPPEQVKNLYVGPLDFTLAGQPVSLVDMHHYDAEKFPLFAEALKRAQSAELEAGDAIFIPSMWWHHVESLESVNVLVNYWWRSSPAYMGNPMDVLTHALLSMRDLPPAQREGWRQAMAHYIFDWNESSCAHIPEKARGVLAPVSDESARKFRAALLNRLNR